MWQGRLPLLQQRGPSGQTVQPDKDPLSPFFFCTGFVI